MPRLTLEPLRAWLLRWSGHDCAAERGAGVAGGWPYRHAEGLPEPGAAGAGDAQARPQWRTSVCVPWPPRRSDQMPLARRTGPMPVHEAAGAWSLFMAFTGGWGGHDQHRTTGLSSVRHRLAGTAIYLAPPKGRVVAALWGGVLCGGGTKGGGFGFLGARARRWISFRLTRDRVGHD